ncbi:hypothetical protein [Xanthomonas hortorum]|uniref:hypothetical protein n=1 Tax=Xanthomonas hortorum TaxID=56454 RepID=UPI00293648C0|nr:hypothetical protein [Xanthomonas hortorum]MDV2453150.1 hypothetical protein [Xanthomonas hortorum NBC5720]
MSEGFLKDLSRDQLAAAIKPTYDSFYQKLSSSQQAKINFDQVVNGAYKVLKGASPLGSPAAHFTTLAAVETAGVAPCIMAVGMVIADVFAIVFQLAGINESESRAAARAILEELGQETIRGIQATIHDFSVAESAMDKARLIWKIISEVYNAIGISGIAKALEDSMHWYDWIITGVTVVAQLVAWFATDGVALIAELALEGVYLAQFTEDVINAQSACA